MYPIGRNSRIAVEVWLDDQDAPTSAMPTAKTLVCLKVQAIYPAYGLDKHFTASNLTFVAIYNYGAIPWQS